MRTRVQKWGNSHAVRLPAEVVRASGLSSGDLVQIDVERGVIRVRRATRKTYSLDELVAGIRPSNRHDEVDVGAPRGRELL
jgi:antitoxin MazE